MYRKIRDSVKDNLEKATGVKISPGEIDDSGKAGEDFSYKTFGLAAKLKKSPAEIAAEISKKISIESVERVEADGPYVNFYLDYGKVAEEFLREVEKKGDSYGRGGSKKPRIVLEHTSINPSGPIHVGRLRNSLIGDSLGRILKFSGYDVEVHYYVNDIGKQIAIIARSFSDNAPPDEELMSRYESYKGKDDFGVFFSYVSGNRRFHADESFRQDVQELIKEAESGDANALGSMQEVARRCLSGQKETFARLGIGFDYFDFESKYIENGDVEKKVLPKLRKERKHVTENDDGFGLDLADFGIERRGGATTILRKDGTSVYLTRDLAYHLEKATRGDELITVLGEDHKFEFIELKCILENFLGFKKPLSVVHFSFVNFEGAELSTRKGLIVPVDALIDDAVEKAGQEIEKRGIAGKENSDLIGIGAIKYHILKTSPQKQITFRWEDALNFDGETAPYIQYAHARCASILEKFGSEVGEISMEGIEGEEKALLRRMMLFPQAVESSASDRKPNTVATYLYHLASDFSRFYKSCQVLGIDDRGIMNRRILIVKGAKAIIRNGLDLLGIEAPERM